MCEGEEATRILAELRAMIDLGYAAIGFCLLKFGQLI
jgi:hypothetical protein